MQLLYLSRENLKDQHFIRELVHSFKQDAKVLLLHDHFGKSLSDTRFVTKRISSLVSDTNIVTNAFSGDQRSIIQVVDGEIKIKETLIKELLQNIQLLILNPIGISGEEAVEVSVPDLIKKFREELQPSELIMFAANSLSPMGNSRPVIDGEEDYQRLLASYEEEKDLLDRAMKMAPTVLATPKNFLS